MSDQDRFFYIPPDAWSNTAKSIDDAWRSAESAIYGAARDPWDTLQTTGNYVEAAARQQWANITDVAPAARMAWNQARLVVDTPCNDPYSFILQTALPPLGDALWLLLTPSPGQILQNYLRPKGIPGAARGGLLNRLARRGRTRSGRTRRGWPVFPDVDEMVAEELPGRQAIAGRPVGRTGRFMWTGIGLADALGLGLMLADIGEGFFYSWAAAMANPEFCSRPHPLLYVGELPAGLTGVDAQQAGQGLAPPWHTLHHLGSQVGPIGTFAAPANAHGSVSLGVVYNFDSPGQQATATLTNLTPGGGGEVVDTHTITLGAGQQFVQFALDGPLPESIGMALALSATPNVSVGPGSCMAWGEFI